MRLLAVCFCLFLAALPLQAQWLPEKKFLSRDGVVATIESFWVMDCKVKDKKILWGSVLIENSTDASFAIKEVSLSDGKSVAPAMTQEEIKKALGGGGLVEKLLSLTDLVKSSMAASNIKGQEVPPKQKGYFTASFLIPKKSPPSEFTLTIGDIGSVVLKK